MIEKKGEKVKKRHCAVTILAAVLTAFFAVLPAIPIRNMANAAPVSAVCVMEVTSRRILYAENADTRLPMASTTKIVTALTVLESCDNLLQEVIIPSEAEGVEGSSIYLKTGESYTVKDLLYGLMLRSGNDAATALALHTCGKIGDFCAKMNEISQKTGALHSRFCNPHGLPQDNHYTTAIDLSLITAYAMQNPTFCDIVATKYYAPYRWQNKNKLLTSYDGAIGVKTGYTKEAGRCLVSAAEREDMRLVCTLLNRYDHYAYTEKLFNDCFQAYEMTKLYEAGQIFEAKLGQNIVKCTLQEDVLYPLLEGEKEHINCQTIAYPQENIDGSVGEIVIRLANGLLFSKKLYKL